jgi:hypothetical protein
VDEIMLFIYIYTYIYTYIHRLSVDGIMLSRYFSRHTQTLGVLEVDSSALISKTVSAQMDDADMKRKERVRILKRLRGEQFNKEEEEASMKQWAHRTKHKLGLRLLTEAGSSWRVCHIQHSGRFCSSSRSLLTLAWFTQADLGHHNGDHIKRVFKKFDSGGAGTIDARY